MLLAFTSAGGLSTGAQCKVYKLSLRHKVSLRGPCNGPWQSLTLLKCHCETRFSESWQSLPVAAEALTIREALPFLKCHCEACVSRLWQSLPVAVEALTPQKRPLPFVNITAWADAMDDYYLLIVIYFVDGSHFSNAYAE